MKGTADALLFIFHDAQSVNGKLQTEAVIEVFVARGYSKDKAALYNELSDGLLDDEMEYLRQQARPEREGAK